MFLLRLIWAVVRALFAKRADLVVENLALGQDTDGDSSSGDASGPVSFVEGRKYLPVIEPRRLIRLS
jgi:hypothetical protein